MTGNQEIKLTEQEEQFIKDMGNDDGFWRYPAYSSPVSASDLLAKVQNNFDRVPSYVEQQAASFLEECDRLGIASLPD